METLYILLGLSIALSSVFLGVGGGVILVPLLTLYSDLGPAHSVATSVATVLILVSYNTYIFSRDKLVDWRVVLWVAPTSLVVSYLVASQYDYFSDRFILTALAVVLAFLTLLLVFPIYKKLAYVPKEGWVSVLFLLFLALIAGGLSGLTGIGSGVLFSSVFLSLGIVASSKMSPTSNACMVFSTASALMAHMGPHQGSYVYGRIHLDVVFVISLTALITATFLKKRQSALPLIWRKGLLATLMIALTLQSLYKLYTSI